MIWIEDSHDIKNMVNNYYKNLFSLKDNWKSWKQTQVSYEKLTEVDITKLNLQVGE